MVFKKGYTPWNKGKKGISDETREKKRALMLGNKYRLGVPHTEKTKKTISEKLLGENNPNYGKSPWSKGLTKETDPRLKYVSELLQGRVFTQTHRNNLSKAGKGREISKEHRNNLSKAQLKFLKEHPEFLIEQSKRLKGKPSAMKGKHHTTKTKKLLQELAIKQFEDPKMRELFRQNRRKIIVPSKDSKPERMMQIALALNGIEFEKHKPLLGQPDIFIEPNICIFVDGDYWHANPIKYDSEKSIFGKYKAKDIWAKDLRIQHELNQLGYQVIRIWESDIKKNVNDCAINIIKLIQSIRGISHW